MLEHVSQRCGPLVKLLDLSNISHQSRESRFWRSVWEYLVDVILMKSSSPWPSQQGSKCNWICLIEFQLVMARDSLKDADESIELLCEL